MRNLRDKRLSRATVAKVIALERQIRRLIKADLAVYAAREGLRAGAGDHEALERAQEARTARLAAAGYATPGGSIPLAPGAGTG
jgi:hypothetical protein